MQIPAASASAEWTPPGLTVSAAKVASLVERWPQDAKQKPTDADDKHEVHLLTDAVFEGGGVKGFCYGGALKACHDFGIRYRKVAGTSAGVRLRCAVTL